MSSPLVRVGVGVLVVKEIEGKKHILMGKRKGSHGAGGWQLPGGHLEFGESNEMASIREVKEETNLDVENVQFHTITNDHFEQENKHYITIFMKCKLKNEQQEPELMEPEKCEGWSWFEWPKLPSPLFLPMIHLLEQNKEL